MWGGRRGPQRPSTAPLRQWFLMSDIHPQAQPRDSGSARLRWNSALVLGKSFLGDSDLASG